MGLNINFSLSKLNSSSEVELDPKNPFLPKKKPSLPLTKNEQGFLKVYSSFAKNMNYLYQHKNRWDLRNTEEFSFIEKSVIHDAEQAGAYLKKNPFFDKDITEKMIKFLDVTSDSFIFGYWMGKKTVSIQPPTNEPEINTKFGPIANPALPEDFFLGQE